jgi:hypothetical protein
MNRNQPFANLESVAKREDEKATDKYLYRKHR